MQANPTLMEIWKCERDIPYLPHKGDEIIFPEDWKKGEQFKVELVQHFMLEQLIVIWVKKIA